ncbi:hypothetical protein BIU14_05545 [Campylobacter fetus]|nr:hypothetical protein [Campylobacter fetus]EAI5944967.1 hypothetical protein [Campylobacter fetus]EAJ0319616.1 hypothetical protein [Campylobacter fetus]EAJ0345512.1 hypothetical protein [Campylobacter fetus]EAJ1239209.1 hypothetical protein [Campylobacter fetus]
MKKIIFYLLSMISFAFADIYNEIENKVLQFVKNDEFLYKDEDEFGFKIENKDEVAIFKIENYVDNEFKPHSDILNLKLSIINKKINKINPKSIAFDELRLNKLELQNEINKLQENRAKLKKDASGEYYKKNFAMAHKAAFGSIVPIDHSSPIKDYTTTGAFLDGYYSFCMYIFMWSDSLHNNFKEKKYKLNYTELFDANTLKRIAEEEGGFSYVYIKCLSYHFRDMIVRNFFIILSLITYIFVVALINKKNKSKYPNKNN